MANGLEQRCRDCEARLQADPHRATLFAAEHPGCECDQVSISPHSPGRVEDGELLARVIIEPKHLNLDDGTVEAASFREACSYGLSLLRLSYVANAHLRRFDESLAERVRDREESAAQKQGRAPEKAAFAGVVRFEAGIVRQHEPGGDAQFCVMDGATESEPFHADVTINMKCKGSEQLRLLNELRKTLRIQNPECRKHLPLQPLNSLIWSAGSWQMVYPTCGFYRASAIAPRGPVGRACAPASDNHRACDNDQCDRKSRLPNEMKLLS
jgi:hypothetical protein